MWWNDYWPAPWFFGPLCMIVIFFACMLMMGFMMRRHRRASSAVDILNERFARGEIDKMEYDERRRVLEV